MYVFEGLQSLQVDVNLALVVGRATAKKIRTAYGRFECRSCPQIQRLGGLDIVMSIKKNSGLAGSMKRFAVYEGMHFGRRNFNVFQTRGAQLLRDPMSGPLNVRLVFAFRADAGDPEKFLQLV